jgi:DNA-3-methyladenine glycosylase I
LAPFQIRPLRNDDRAWVAKLLEREWGATRIVTRGRLYQADRLPGFVAVRDGRPCGLVAYRLGDGDCEIISLNSLLERIGVGSALIAAVREAAVAAGCRRLWLITTNDNLAALRFYQRRGFRLAALYPNALEASRRLKPEIPLVGHDGIPLRDELELELPL